MLPADPRLPACPAARGFEATVDELLRKTTAETSKEAYLAILGRLRVLKEQLEASLSPFHYQAMGTGTVHRCVSMSFAIAECYLESKAALAPVPEPPPPPPAPSPQPLSDEDLMERLKDYVTDRTKETFFGQDQAEEDEPKEGSS
jgi:hypothetical protein